MVAQEISKRIQSVILPNSNPNFKSDSRPDSMIGHQIGGTARRKSFYIGDPDGDMDNSDPDNNPSNNDDNDDEEEDEEEDFWSLPMGEPVRPFVAGNKFTRAKSSSPKVPDLGTVKEEEEDEDEQGGRMDQEVESKEGSYFPTVPRVSCEHDQGASETQAEDQVRDAVQHSRKTVAPSYSTGSSHSYISRYPLISLPRRRSSLEIISLNSPVADINRSPSPKHRQVMRGKGDVKRLYESGPSNLMTSRVVDKENVRVEKEWQELLPPSVCLVSPEEGGLASSIFESQTQELTERSRPCSGFAPIDGNISVILHQHDPTIPTYSSRDSIASLILKNPSQGLDANKGLLFDYEEQDDRLTEEAFPGDEGDAYMTARRRESYLDTADSESESDNDMNMNMDTDMSTDKDLQTRRSTSIGVHVSPETSEPEDTFETPRPPSKVRAARRVSLTVSTSRLKTLEREHAAIAIQPNQEGEKRVRPRLLLRPLRSSLPRQ